MQIDNYLSSCSDLFDSDPFDTTSLAGCVPTRFIEANPQLRGGYTKNRVHHIFGGGNLSWHGIERWGNPAGWRRHSSIPSEAVIFCESVIGDQFFFSSASDPKVWWYSPFTNQIEEYASDYDEFFEEVIVDKWGVNVELNEIVEVAGVPKDGMHLTPRQHPMLGGSLDALGAWAQADAIENMYFNVQLSAALQQLPPGSQVKGIEYNSESRALIIEF